MLQNMDCSIGHHSTVLDSANDEENIVTSTPLASWEDSKIDIEEQLQKKPRGRPRKTKAKTEVKEGKRSRGKPKKGQSASESSKLLNFVASWHMISVDEHDFEGIHTRAMRAFVRS